MNTLRTFVLLALLPALLFAQTRGMKNDQPGVNREKRIALVIGNGAYKNIPPLKNPSNDANAMAAKLKSLGFSVISRINVNKKQMREAIQQFGLEILGSGVGLFYYAGHGIQNNGRNYLIPVNAGIASEGDIEDEAVSVDQILSRMGDAGNRMNIVILDACRNNPFSNFRGVTRGLTQMLAPSGTFIAYATSPGSVADDGAGANGIYTQALLKEIAVPGAQLEDVFKNVLSDVKKQTRNKQVPWTSSSVEGRFYFTRPTAERPVPDEAQDKELDLSDLVDAARREQFTKNAWSNRLEKIRTAYNEVLAYEQQDVSAGLVASAWSRFLGTYADQDPYSSDDDSMRVKANERLVYWNELRIARSSSSPVVLPTNGLVAYYPFNGSANDASGNGFNGIVHGAMLVADRFGYPNSAYSFNGRNNYIDCGDVLDSVFCAPVARFTVSGWAFTRTPGTRAGGGGCIVTKSGGGDAGPYQWSITHDVDGFLYADVFSEPSGRNQILEKTNGPAPLNEWFQFIYIFDGSLPERDRLKIYVNGKISEEQTVLHRGVIGTTTTNTPAHLCIGSTLNLPALPSNFYDGVVDNIRIYNRALNYEEIQIVLHDMQ